jgi:hypothetical protein
LKSPALHPCVFLSDFGLQLWESAVNSDMLRCAFPQGL